MQTLADVHVSRGLYTAMRLDTLSARKFGYRIIDDMRRETGSISVSARIYAEGVKIAEADTTWTGEKRFKFVDE
jgi:hypothetical protein